MLLSPRSWRRLAVRTLLLAPLLASAGARAQEFAADTALPSPDQLGFTNFASTRTPGHLGVDATMWLDYAFRLQTSSYSAIEQIEHRLGATLIAQLGLWSRGAVAIRLPVALYQNAEYAPSASLFPEGVARQVYRLDRQAVGNPAIDGRVRVLGATVRPDGTVADGAALAVRGVVHLPFATKDSLFGDQQFRAELSLITDIQMFGIGAGAALSYRYRRFGHVGYPELRPASEPTLPGEPASEGEWRSADPREHALRLSLGLRVPLPLLSRAYPGRVQEAALVELDVQTWPSDFQRRLIPVEGRLGYRAIVGDIFTTLTFGAGLTEAFGAPDFRTTLAVGWSPRQHDQDADGVPDGSDQCAHLPEDRDGYLDEDGCADDDNDGDLIVDEDDRCPMQPAEMDRDDDEDGCTDT